MGVFLIFNRLFRGQAYIMMILSQGYFTHSFTYVSGSIATGGDVGMQVVIMVETARWDVSTYLSNSRGDPPSGWRDHRWHSLQGTDVEG